MIRTVYQVHTEKSGCVNVRMSGLSQDDVSGTAGRIVHCTELWVMSSLNTTWIGRGRATSTAPSRGSVAGGEGGLGAGGAQRGPPPEGLKNRGSVPPGEGDPGGGGRG